MRILVGIPCLYHHDLCKRAIDSVYGKPNVDILLVDNGAEKTVSELIQSYDCLKIINEQNIFVNPAWNPIIATFLSGGWDYLAIMNSDLILQSQWSEVCFNRWNVSPDEILIPQMLDAVPRKVYTNFQPSELVTEGTAGVFITLNRKQAEIIYPIPEEIKVWFGDNWIYSILRALGYVTVIPPNLFSYHAWSSTVSKVPGISEIIESDKVAWAEVVEPRMIERITKFKTDAENGIA